MAKYRVIKSFSDKYPNIGPIMWMLSFQYFLTQYIVANGWANSYSLTKNTISDLGNTVCALRSNGYVCSPLHSLMNASFVTLGVFMAIGSLLIYQEFKESLRTLIGFSCMLIAGVGTILVGIFPENTISVLHGIGAFLPFFIGNLGILILGITLNIPKLLRNFTQATGIVALIAFFLFVSHIYLGIGRGGMERVTAYPQTLWLIIFGIYISKNHYLKLKTKPNSIK